MDLQWQHRQLIKMGYFRVFDRQQTKNRTEKEMQTKRKWTNSIISNWISIFIFFSLRSLSQGLFSIFSSFVFGFLKKYIVYWIRRLSKEGFVVPIDLILVRSTEKKCVRIIRMCNPIYCHMDDASMTILSHFIVSIHSLVYVCVLLLAGWWWVNWRP